jgi:hypothetical protein
MVSTAGMMAILVYLLHSTQQEVYSWLVRSFAMRRLALLVLVCVCVCEGYSVRQYIENGRK